jgi:hypothetical protein
MISWTPYALFTLYTAFISEIELDGLTLIAAEMMAKTSLVWPAVLNLTLNKQISRKVKHFASNFSLTKFGGWRNFKQISYFDTDSTFTF